MELQTCAQEEEYSPTCQVSSQFGLKVFEVLRIEQVNLISLMNYNFDRSYLSAEVWRFLKTKAVLEMLLKYPNDINEKEATRLVQIVYDMGEFEEFKSVTKGVDHTMFAKFCLNQLSKFNNKDFCQDPSLKQR